MKVLLIGNYAPDGQESMQRFSAMLETELRALGHQVSTLQPRPRFNRRGAAPSGLAKWLGYIDKFVLFPPLLKRAARRADIVHICDHSNSFYVRILGARPHIITCHDMLAIRSALGMVPQNPTSATGKVLQKIIVSGLNRAQLVACVSENTRQELLEITDLKAEQTAVAENGFNYPYSPMPAPQAAPILSALLPQLATQAGEVKPYIAHVGGNQWYKNRGGVLEIYRALRELMGEQTPALVMAGKTFTAEMNAYVEAHELSGVIRISNLSNEELRALYSRAELFLFPSLAEGFGWPIIEAQACGCRVLTTDAAPMNEVGAASAYYADPADPTDFARSIMQLLEQPSNIRQASVEAGLANVERFDPRARTETYLQLYREQIAHRKA